MGMVLKSLHIIAVLRGSEQFWNPGEDATGRLLILTQWKYQLKKSFDFLGKLKLQIEKQTANEKLSTLIIVFLVTANER